MIAMAITVPHPMSCNGALYLAPNTQTCLFLGSGIVIFAPAGAVFIAIIKPWCLTSLWCVHWLTNSHARMGMHQVAWSSMEMPRKCHGKWHPDTVGALSKPVKLFVSGRHSARI